MNHLLRDDPLRLHVYGFTIEKTTVRLWYCDRSQILASDPFDFSVVSLLFCHFLWRCSR